MSIEISNLYTRAYVHSGKRIGVSNSQVQEKLSDYVRRVINEKGLNYREVARRSGGTISHSTVGDIINDPTKDVQTETLRALAKGLGVPLRELQAAAGGEPMNETEFQDSALYFLHQQRLTADDETKRLIDQTIQMLLNEIERAKTRSPSNNNNNDHSGS